MSNSKNPYGDRPTSTQILRALMESNEFKNISVIGLGYIGHQLQLCLQNQAQCYGRDVDTNVVNKINKGEIHIKEPLLDNAKKKLSSQKTIASKSWGV